MKRLIKKILKLITSSINHKNDMQQILLNQGKILTELYCNKNTDRLCDYEWKVFSQWGEDGIIQFLVSEVDIQNKTFIEFGVEDFFESNLRYLLMSSDWQGFVIDGSPENINRLKNSSFFWRHDLQAIDAFIDTDNINELLRQSNFDRDLGILSIDIDGNDYHVLESIDSFEARIIICEFNPYFGKDRAITVPYDPKFNRTAKHHSNLYFGTSIRALQHLLKKKGYSFVGTGLMGGNAYFVRSDLMTDKLTKMSLNPMNFNGHCRESRDEHGKLNYLRGDERLDAIRGLPVINVETGLSEHL